jgi:hypothetical protein
MKSKNKIIFAFALIFMSLFPHNFAYCEKNEWRNGPFYYFYSGENGLSDSLKETLQRDVEIAFNRSSVLGKVSMPAYLKIVIAENPGIFSNITKMSGSTAGCYDIKNRRLVIQHPDLLLKRNILDRTLFHESLHWMLAEKRGSNRTDNYYFDEFLTEALSPSSNNIKATRNFFPGNYASFLEKISTGISSQKYAKRMYRDAMRMWGAYILKAKGTDGLVNYVVENKPGFDPEILYGNFLKDIGD